MKKLFFAISILLAFGMITAVAFAEKRPVNGPHYNLQIIGSKTSKDVGDSDGHTMFVLLNGKTKIIMTQSGGDFLVVDRNGTDGTAEFNIAPGYYNVYARALGKPKGEVDITAWGEFKDALDGSVLLWLGYVNLTRSAGKPQSVNINELFYVDVTLCTAMADPDGVPDSGDEYCTQQIVYTDTWVFDIPELLEYYWNYDNKGLKLLQVRFYPCTLDCSGTATNYCMWADSSPICSSKTIVDLAPPKVKANNVTTTWAAMKN